MSLEIVNGGALTTVQDLGRFGYMNKGFQVSGAVDDQAMRLANILVGNDQKEAVLHLRSGTLPDAVLRVPQ